jgi:hypothetical protein
VTFLSLRKRAASQVGSVSGPARSFRTRSRAACQELDDGCGGYALGARDMDDMGTRLCPCARINGDLIVFPGDFLTHYAIPLAIVLMPRTLQFQLG